MKIVNYYIYYSLFHGGRHTSCSAGKADASTPDVSIAEVSISDAILSDLDVSTTATIPNSVPYLEPFRHSVTARTFWRDAGNVMIF
jgi:hypothetical protein